MWSRLAWEDQSLLLDMRGVSRQRRRIDKEQSKSWGRDSLSHRTLQDPWSSEPGGARPRRLLLSLHLPYGRGGKVRNEVAGEEKSFLNIFNKFRYIIYNSYRRRFLYIYKLSLAFPVGFLVSHLPMAASNSKLDEAIRRLSRNDTTLTSLDLKGNLFGNQGEGVRLLADALTINSTLTFLGLSDWDSKTRLLVHQLRRDKEERRRDQRAAQGNQIFHWVPYLFSIVVKSFSGATGRAHSNQ